MPRYNQRAKHHIARHIIAIAIANPAEIHIGDSTHHHDQSITLHSFRATKSTVNIPASPIPPDEDEDDVLINSLSPTLVG